MTICSERLYLPDITVSSFVELLQQRAASAPDCVAYRFLGDGETGESSITYGELNLRARAIAASLQETGACGERALLLYPAGLAYVEAFFGCLYAGVIAVPAPPPRLNRNVQRLQTIVTDAEATFALTNAALLTRLESIATRLPELARLRWLATDTINSSLAGTYLEPELSADSLAYLQYTSGSTATPKGVMVTHGNVLHNSASIHQGFAHTPDSRALTWLPHFHDMGLIDGIIQPLYGGFPVIIMSPASFLQQPLRWLEAVTRFQITHTGGPNFAYDLCLRRVNTEQRARLDLRSWRVAYNGAEPVRFETLRRFADKFRECGFRREAFYPAYGLAEATLKVTGGSSAEPPVVCTVRTDALEQHRVVEAVPEQDNTRTLVGCGHEGLDTEIEIVDAETFRRCAREDVGEIWVHGPGVAAGYWRRPEETEAKFHARLAEADELVSEKTYLRTGDLGFVRSGELFVTGRVKDLIIIRGRNLYPHDLELAVEQSHETLRTGGAAAFSLDVEGEERLVVVQELEARRRADLPAVIELIRQTLAEEFEVQPYAILLVKAGSVPKTSSGKIQRSACRARFETGAFDALAEWRAPLDFGIDNSEQIETAELSNSEAVATWIRGQLAAKLGLGASSIDIDSSITRYGVDSLIAIELAHSIETQLGVLLPMSEFISSQSITQIAVRCFELIEATRSAPAVGPTSSVEESNVFPLSHGQQALWFLQQLAPESVAYYIASALRIKTKPDEIALRSAFQSLVERHATLRTTFSAVQGRAMQHVHEGAKASFEIVDATRWDDATLAERLRDEAHLPFDLEHGPLLRALLFRRADDEQVLLVVAHHIVIDFWSLAILMRELGELYRAATNGATAKLAPHTSNYFDYVRYEQHLLSGEAGERLAGFWQKQLAGELPVLNLHTDRPRPAGQTFRGASEPLRLDAQLTARLKALSQANDATLFMTLLAAFKVLLYRYTGQEDLLVGSPTAGRQSAQFASTVGYFVNPVVLRTSPHGAVSFAEFLRQVRHTTLATFARQEYPFALLVKQLQPERDPSRSPLFQVMFTLNKAQLSGEEAMGAFSLGEEGARMNLGGLPLESMRLEQRIAQFDLSLTMVEAGNELSASLEYNTDLFDTATIKRMLGHFQTLLAAVVVGPSQRLDRLPLLADSERHLLLDEWSGAVEDRATAKGVAPFVHQLFEQHVEQHPENTAVVFEGARLNYGELNARANRLAHYLRRRGVGMDVPVAICVERSLEMVVAVMGVLKSGGAYVPLDPRYPRERLAFMLAETRAPWLLTQKHLVEGLPASGARPLFLDEVWDEIALESEDNPKLIQQPESLAYVIYTSGSTGRPKGVMVSHRSLAAAYQSWRQPYLLDSSPCVLQTANFSFDVFTADILRGLISGGRLVLCSRDTMLSPENLYELMRSEKVELAEFVPALMRPLLQYVQETRQTFDFMRVFICGSDALYAEEHKTLREFCSAAARVINSYGLTEATIDNIIFESSAANVHLNGFAPIGRPFAGVRAYLLDSQLQPVPVGVAGELYVGGDCVARGYLKRPDLTATRFLPNPFADGPGARLYHTGDLARFLADGNVEFLGRKDEQVKVRGYRIELGEVEATLKRHTRVRDAIVVTANHGNGTQRGETRLVAYVVVEGDNLGSKQLREFLAESLSEQMIPSAFVLLDAIPLTPNGKIDRRALPPPDFSADFSGSDTVQTEDVPRTEAECILSGIWSELLKLERIGLRDNFFHLGGDSILSIQVIARARQSGLLLTPRQIFEHPTLAALASVAETISQTMDKQEDEQGRITGDVSLTPIQRWFFEQNFPTPAHWNMSLLLETNERLDTSLVEKTLAHLLEHHDALRLRFVRDDSGWRQSIASHEDPLRCVRGLDLSRLTGEEQTSAMEAAAEEAQRGLNLGNGPLVRVVLFDLGAGGQRLLFVVHHLVVDGVSWRILLEDWEHVYRQLLSSERVELPSKTTSFQRWAKRLDQLAQTREVQKELDYWKAISGHLDLSGPLRTSAISALTEDSQRRDRRDTQSAAENTEGSSRTFAVSLSIDETNALLQDVPPVYHTLIDDVLLTALVRAFRRWTGDDALLAELEKHGREELFEDVDLSRTVGWFTSAFPVLLKLSETATTLGDDLKSMKEQLRRIPRGGIGYGLLRYLCRDEEVVRQMSALPRADVSFNYLGQFDQTFQASGLFQLARDSSGAARDRDAQRGNLLEVNAGIFGGRLQAEWTYSAEIHNSVTVEKLAHDFLEELQALIAHCLSTKAGAYTPSDFPLARINQMQLDELLQTRNDVVDLFHLSPMQQGMLFHIIYTPNTDVYLGQFSCALEGDLDANALNSAWQQTLNRHDVLRASFIWEELDEPLQLIHKSVRVPVEQHDWRALSDDEQRERLEAFLITERQRGFNLSTPPLMRLALVHLSNDSYRFVWTHHHLLIDGWSGALLLREVFDTYEALRRGEQMRIEPRRPFRDYIAWLDRQDLSQAESFWRENLKGFDSPTPLVIDHTSADTDGSMEAAGENEVQLSQETTSQLQSLARKHGLTLNTILAGAWALLLNRYSQEETVVFGATVAGRPPSLSGVETMIGLFINTLPVRVRVDEEAELLTWLTGLQAEQVILRDYEYSPLVEVQSWSEVGRGRPLFESLLVFENYPLDAAALKENLSLHLKDVRSFDRTNYPLTVVAIPAEELFLQALYDRRRFTANSIERLLGHLRTLLESIAAQTSAASQTLAELQLLPSREREQVLVEWNDTARDYPQDLWLHEMFEAQVERTPDRIAAVHTDEDLTYRELNARANKLARYLRKLGVGPETCVGVLMERSLEMLVALLGVLKAGGAYVPLDPEYPQERLAFMLADSGATALLTQQRLVEFLPAHRARLICVDTDDAQAIDKESAENLPCDVIARNLAYVIYTSGSTGWPKGTAIEHRSAAILSQWARESFEPEAFAGTLALTSICFDLSIFELFVPLHCGGKVIIVRDVLHLSQVPATHQVTLINTVPSAIDELLQLNYLPDSAYVVNLAGEPLQKKLVQQLYERKTVKQVFNLYGPTEDTTYSTWGLMNRDDHESPAVGRPISNTQAYVLDRRGRPLPIGIPGELHLGGMGLARGYLGRPDLTAEKFIPDPFNVEPGARMYRTGDVARFRPDGRIDFLGRMDHQVKIRGYRIELGEIEAALTEYPSVKTCVVVARADADDDKRLVAYIVARDGEKPGHLELRSFLRARLLEQMVPSAFVLLDEMPLTPNGKINRRALPAPEVSRPDIEQRYVAPRNDIEAAVVELWQEVLGINPIGVSDNFFDLGGHSLKATSLLSKVRRIFRTELPLSVVFQATTIEALACALVEHEAKPGQTAKIAHVLQRIKSITSSDLKDELERKRREKPGPRINANERRSDFEAKQDEG
jgi:amino acid adenylation domain-containing protein/non-ribosomal peptide synthase protein (TIGR01720 family)